MSAGRSDLRGAQPVEEPRLTCLRISRSLIVRFVPALLLALLLFGPAAARAAQEADAEVMKGMGVTESADGPEASDEAMRKATGETEWRYDTYYLFPLTRHMPDSGLPLYGQIMLYPLSAAIDLVQLPIGALAGLAGE